MPHLVRHGRDATRVVSSSQALAVFALSLGVSFWLEPPEARPDVLDFTIHQTIPDQAGGLGPGFFPL